MARKLKIQNIKRYSAATYEGASAYDYSKAQPLTHLTFTMGSALFTDGFYETEVQQVRKFAEALMGAWLAEPRFAWQYAAWIRDPKNGKGNRIQGSLAPALLDSLVDECEDNERYIAMCLSHRPDDVTAFLRHFERLGLGRPSAGARRAMAEALSTFDEYQLMKYAEAKADVRLCDAILVVRAELEALGADGALALAVGEYLHAPSRDRAARAEALPLTRARRQLWQKSASYALDDGFPSAVLEARVTWEQVLSHFGFANPREPANRAVWEALLQRRRTLGDMAFLRNVRNMLSAGVSMQRLVDTAGKRRFDEVWPHQVYAGFKAYPEGGAVFDVAFNRMVARLPAGRHLGIGDASGSMGVRLGGPKASMTCMDAAFCLVALMSETSGLGASFADDSFLGYSDGYLSMAERKRGESPLVFSQRRDLRKGWGGTQVFGAVMELIEWLERNDRVAPPDCLWFFSDMQFHPAAGNVPPQLLAKAKRHGLGANVPPLELALQLYRAKFGHVDVVLWNLASYAPVPVPADMKGVLLVSGFDANTFAQVEAWRSGKTRRPVERNQEAVLATIRGY